MDLDAGSAVLGAVMIAAAAIFIGCVLILIFELVRAKLENDRYQKEIDEILEMDLTRPTRD